MKWNNEQKEAIYSSGKNIVVSASAGAGKTAILVERLLTICTRDENPIDLNRIVAMTFTDAAASEMKKRLSKKLSEKLNEPGVNKELIEKQLIYLNTAQISTIHSFCLSIIKKYYDVISLNPLMIENNLDESIVTTIKQNAFLKAFYNYQDNHDVNDLISFFSNNVFSLNKLQEAILEIVDAANSTFDADNYYDLILSKYKNINRINEIDEDILDLFFSDLKLNFNILKSSFSNLKDQFDIEKASLKKADEITKKFELIKYHFNNINTAIDDKNYSLFYESITKLNDKAIKFNNDKKAMSIELQAYNKIYRDTINNMNKEYFDESIYINSNNEILPIINQLTDLAKLTNIEIKNEKIKINGFDFDDMEHFAYEILKSNNQMIANELKTEIDEILVDEFQDTNEIQNEIINLISKGNNIFRVGDVKQSIYRFRKAKPSIMRNMMNDENYQLIALKNNYRSKDNIIEFTNLLFQKIMNIDSLEDKYKDSDIVSSGISSQKEYKDNTIAFYALNEAEGYNNSDLKADFISDKINDLVLNKEYKYKDFVILLRGHAHKKELLKSFEKFNIPYFIDSKSGFYNSYMSRIITSYLKLLNNTNDAISLMAVLTSPLYEVSDEEIALMKINHGDLLSGCINTNHKIIDDINKLKKLSTISEILEEIALINNFINDKCDNQQRTNFDLYFEKILDFEKNSQNLGKFIELIETNTDEKSSEAISVGIDEDVVRVMTIHQSKGLQFKVVFLWGNSNSSNSFNTVLTSPNGIALDNIERKYYTIKEKTIHRIALEYEDNIEEAQEFIRILYVALTRAQEEMYIVDTVKKPLNNTTYDLKTLLKNNKKITNTLLEALEDQNLFKIHYIDEYDFVIPKQTKEKDTMVLPLFSYKPKNDIEVITPSKTSHEISLELDFNKVDTYKRGLLMHEAIEKLPDTIWDKQTISTITGLNKHDIEHLIRFNRSEIYQKALNMQIHHEFPFIFKEDTKIINGIIDFIAIDENNIIIIDFKSDKNVTEDELLVLYKSQLDFYHQTISKKYPHHHIETYIYSFELDKFININ